MWQLLNYNLVEKAIKDRKKFDVRFDLSKNTIINYKEKKNMKSKYGGVNDDSKKPHIRQTCALHLVDTSTDADSDTGISD